MTSNVPCIFVYLTVCAGTVPEMGGSSSCACSDDSNNPGLEKFNSNGLGFSVDMELIFEIYETTNVSCLQRKQKHYICEP